MGLKLKQVVAKVVGNCHVVRPKPTVKNVGFANGANAALLPNANVSNLASYLPQENMGPTNTGANAPAGAMALGPFTFWYRVLAILFRFSVVITIILVLVGSILIFVHLHRHHRIMAAGDKELLDRRDHLSMWERTIERELKTLTADPVPQKAVHDGL